MKLDSEHLEILAMIVEKGGLTEGAEALGKSQPSVSRTISMLEKRIGLPLFEPGRRPLQPTEFGKALAEIGSRIHGLNQQASAMVSGFHRGHVGHLRVGGTPLFMDGVIAPILADFQDKVGGAQFDQAYGYFDSLAVKLRNRTIDMAFLPMTSAPVPSDMRFVSILPGRNVIACRVGHPLIRRGPITLADIEAYSWISPSTDSPLYRDLRRAIASIGATDFRLTLSGGTLASICSFLARSDCLTVLPYSVVYSIGEQNRIAALPIKIAHPDRSLGILTRADEELPPVGQSLVKFVVKECESLQNRMEREQQLAMRRD